MSTSVRLYADDTIMYMNIQSDEDAKLLQQDLDKLNSWSGDWLMELNPRKCHSVTVTRKRTIYIYHHQYTLNGIVLDTVPSAKYLGITITTNLKWNQHISNICQKANNTLAFLRRNLRIHSTQLKTTAYQALVRPLVEYGSMHGVGSLHSWMHTPTGNDPETSSEICAEPVSQHLKRIGNARTIWLAFTSEEERSF